MLSALAVWTVLFSVYIVSERRSPAASIAWILSFGFLPLLGFAVYYFLGPRRFDRKKRRRADALATMQKVHPMVEDEEDEHESAAQFLVAMNIGALGFSATLRRAELRLFFSGMELYQALLDDIAAATHHINMEYYVWEPDQIGTRVRDALVKRAKEGISIRLHLDGVGAGKANKAFWQPLTAAGGHVVHFNPLAIRRRVGNFRTHRKIVVIDGRIGYCGGMNITDVHSTEFLGEKAWRDTHLRLAGPAVRGLQTVFNEGWFDSTREIIDGPDYFPELEGSPSDPCVQIVSSGPDETRNAVHKLLAASIFSSSSRVYLTTPYFVPDATTIDALSAAALRGADVRVLVPKKNDLIVIGAASRSYYPNLLDMGVRVFEYVPAMVHSKTLVVDDLVAVVGTANADNRSFRLNFEVVVASYDGNLCEQLADSFINELKSSEEVTFETIENYGRLRRLGQSFARLVSPLL